MVRPYSQDLRDRVVGSVASGRGLIEEMNAASTDELVLIDMAVVAYANAMRLQAMIDNTALIIKWCAAQKSLCSMRGRRTAAVDRVVFTVRLSHRRKG